MNEIEILLLNQIKKNEKFLMVFMQDLKFKLSFNKLNELIDIIYDESQNK